MRPPRAPALIWLPFVFSVGGVSWAILVASLGLLAAVMLAPEAQKLRAAEAQRNEVAATLALLDQRIALQRDFLAETNEPELMVRLASRQLHLERKGQEILVLNPESLRKDRSVRSLLAESLVPVKPEPVRPIPWYLQGAIQPTLRPLLLTVACAGLLLSFVLGIRYERPRAAE